MLFVFSTGKIGVFSSILTLEGKAEAVYLGKKTNGKIMQTSTV